MALGKRKVKTTSSQFSVCGGVYENEKAASDHQCVENRDSVKHPVTDRTSSYEP